MHPHSNKHLASATAGLINVFFILLQMIKKKGFFKLDILDCKYTKKNERMP